MELLNLLDFMKCTDEAATITSILKKVITFLQMIIPIALILWGTVDMGRAVIAGDEKKIKERQKPFIWRLVSAVIVFLIPFIVNWVINIFVSDASEWKDCWNSDKQYEKINSKTLEDKTK